jgi:hypothetical protein
MPAHAQLRVGGGHPLEGGRPALPAIRHDELVGVQGKLLQTRSVMLIGDDHLIQPLRAQIVAALQASATPAGGLHPHQRSSTQADAPGQRRPRAAAAGGRYQFTQ